MAGYPSRIVRMLHLKAPWYATSKRICGARDSSCQTGARMECWGASAYDGHKQTDVRFCKPVAHEVILAGEDRLETVERVEELVDRVFVGLLRPSEPTLVYAICRRVRTRIRHHSEFGSEDSKRRHALFTVS